MAGTDRKTPHAVTLLQEIQQRPYAFDFLQALRRLECIYAAYPRLGESKLPKEDPVRLAQQPSLRFEPSSIHSVEAGKEGRPDRLLVTFFGLFGPHGPLPLHLTDYACDRTHHANDSTVPRFADIFHHRMLCLLYRVWANVQPTVNYDRPDEDRFARFVGTLCGIGDETLLNRDAMPDGLKLHFSSYLACGTKHRDGLLAMLIGFFGVDVEIEPFVGQWLHLPATCRWFMGSNPTSGCLGESAVVGAAIWDCQYHFRIFLGPLTYTEFKRFLPSGDSLKKMVAIVQNYLGGELSWDVVLILKKDEVPEFELGKSGQLGWNTWCSSFAPEKDVYDVCLDPER